MSNSIKVELVAATLGAVVDQRADCGLLVTTSRFLPSAQAFAARNRSLLRLATSADVANWSEAIASTKTENEWLHASAPSWRIQPDKIVVTTLNLGAYWPEWAVVVAETPSAARLALLNSVRTPSRLGDETIGIQQPDIDTLLDPNRPITARRRAGGFLGDDGNMYLPWNGQPLPYDYND